MHLVGFTIEKYCLGINLLLVHWSMLRNKDQEDAFFFLNFFFNNLSCTCLEYINYSSTGGSYYIYAAYGIYRASALTHC